MPLSDSLTKLDDRSYDSIVEEMRARIARYTPEWKPVWTDVNDSDPGITMLQVFAWMTELLTYRMNRVPDLNYIKFLQLLGIELRAAEPAYAEITFPVKTSHPTSTVIVPTRTMIMTEAPDGGAPIIFETAESLTCIRPKLAAVLAYDGSAFAKVTDQNDAASGFQPLGPTARVDSALYLGFEDSAAFPGTEFTLYAWVAEDSQKPAPVTCGLPTANSYAPAELEWEYWTGFEWAGLSVLKDETLAFTRSGRIILKSLPSLLAVSKQPFYTDADRTWIRARVTETQYEEPPKIAAIRTNTMRLTQMETVVNELLGGSEGRRGQTFKLTNTPIIAASLKLQIDEGSGWEYWTEVVDFLASGPDDRHYTLNRTTGEIRFGDGFNGAIPIANANRPGANIIAEEYRYGGGLRGNVGAGVLDNIRNAVAGIDSNGIINVMAAYGGRDEETLDEAKKYAPAAIRSRCRAVSTDDFEYLAAQAGSVARAKALPRCHPSFPNVDVPGVVSVIVVPDSSLPNPMPSDGTLRTVCEYLDSRRLLTTEVYVLPPSYRKVKVVADVVAQPNVDTAQVQREIEAAFLAYFHPLTGGEDGLGWPFGGSILFSRVFQRIFGVAGVAFVRSAIIELDGESQPACTDVSIGITELVYSTEHSVSVTYDFGGTA